MKDLLIVFIVQGHSKKSLTVCPCSWDIGADLGGGVAGFPFWFPTNSHVLWITLLTVWSVRWTDVMDEKPFWHFIQHLFNPPPPYWNKSTSKWLGNLCMWLVFTPGQKGRRMDYRASVHFDHLWLGMIGAARNRILIGLQFVCNSVYRPIC